MTSSILPKGWRWAKLATVGRFESGGTPSKDNPEYWQGSIPFVTGADVTDFDIFSHHARAFLTDAGLASGKTAVCHPSTILFVTRTRVGRAGIAREIMGASQDLSPYVCGPQLLPEYACWFLRRISNVLIANSRGSTIQGLTREFVYSLEIPLPPLSEQKRIAAILTDQMAAVEKARAATKEQLSAVEALSISYFNQGLNGIFPRIPLGEVLKEIQGGKSLSCEERPALENEWGVLKVSAVSWGEFQSDENKVLPQGFLPRAEHEVRSGDLLMLRANTTELVGATVLVGETRPHLMLSDKTLRLVLKETRIDPGYLEIALRERKARNFIETNATGTSPSMKNISQETIRRIPLLLPSLDTQRAILAAIRNRESVCSQIKIAIQARQKALVVLPTKILRQAFSGYFKCSYP